MRKEVIDSMAVVLADRYRLISLVGRGVSAEVWVAHDDRLDRLIDVVGPAKYVQKTYSQDCSRTRAYYFKVA